MGGGLPFYVVLSSIAALPFRSSLFLVIIAYWTFLNEPHAGVGSQRLFLREELQIQLRIWI